MAANMAEKERIEKEHQELQDLYIAEKHNSLRFQEMISQAELRQMVNTLNPHFLFNTLNVIYKTSLQENAEETSSLIDATSQYLRYNLDYSENTSNLIHELSSIKDFIHLIKIRIGDRIDFHVDIPDKLPNIEIPGVILQPIIQNAVEYAFHEDGETLNVWIDVIQEGDTLSISISDDGVGMLEENVDEIMMNNTQFFNRSSNLSLYTIMYRLKAHFKSDVNIAINTCDGCGFEVQIEINLGGYNETNHNR